MWKLNEFPSCYDRRNVGEIWGVRWYRKSFLKYRAEKYNENKRYISLPHADGRWSLIVVSIIVIYIQQQMHFILKYPVPNCKLWYYL
jgi:steroid 5-alpha reductase family enzyme